MAVTHITAVDHSDTDPTNSFSITLPTTQPNDTLTVDVVHMGTAEPTLGGTSVTTGGLTWTKEHAQPWDGTVKRLITYSTVATGDHSGQTVTASGLTNSCSASLNQYRGGDPADPLGAATIVGEANTIGDETQAEITTDVDGAWVVLVVGNIGRNVTDMACTSPGALTERSEADSNGGIGSRVTHASLEKATAGATGAFTWSQFDEVHGSIAYAIKPAAAAANFPLHRRRRHRSS